MSWHPEAYQPLLFRNYQQVAQFYEQLLETEPDVLSYYCYLGLTYLLQQQEEQAQSTWLFAMSEGTEAEIEQWTAELVEILETEAQRQQENGNDQLSWLIRGHIQDIAPSNLNNLLSLIDLEIKLNCFTPESLEQWQLIDLLQQSLPNTVDLDLLLQILPKILLLPYPQIIAFTDASYSQIPEETLHKIIVPIAHRMAYEEQRPSFAADLIEVGLKYKPNSIDLLDQLFWLYVAIGRNTEAIAVANQFYEQANSLDLLDLKLYANYLILYILMRNGAWQDLGNITQRHKELLHRLIDTRTESIDPYVRDSFPGVTMPLLYLQDNLKENRYFINQISKLFQKSLPNQLKASVYLNTNAQPRPLKIGYIGHSFKEHAVGWLNRWLFHYHDRNAFKIAIYLVNQPEDKLTKEWFRANADLAYNFRGDAQTIAKQIEKDQIDILVDLDSQTNNLTCQVMALKPAPIQVTWLGLDASGIPAIDYYIADTYILPEEAQDYYQEKIWRLPHCYIAVDGFETGVPTLRREQLNIKSEAIIYLSVQTGLKRHPDTIRLQMQVLKAVPESYFLIQGAAQEDTIKQLFIEIAQEEGIAPERLRFLPLYPLEIYRANLAIADVVLDTYPFNGGATTLDILWQGIPVVTRVGQQWAARNGYTLLTNAGLKEGIAWTDEEYVEWGVKLGTDEGLRKQIFNQLRAGRKTAPLWNAQQFTREMEKAYQQMWNNL